MSFLGKKWEIGDQNEAKDLIETLLASRNLADESSRRAFFDDSIAGLHDPLLFKAMPRAVERIRRAIDQKEKIMVFGDYDVDGVSGTAILIDFFRSVGADAHSTLPHRENDGYGPKDYFMRRFAESGVRLLITVDCGTSSLSEIALANQLGMEVIVTDHHSVPKTLPPALAVLNPKLPDSGYPNPHLSGSAVAWKLVAALAPHYLAPKALSEALYRYLGLAALGLVADCMPLLGENRLMLRHGLNSLQHAHHPGLRALLESAGAAGKPITSQTIGFTIAPRLNAAGRLDTPQHALELLLGDPQKAETLGRLNFERREMVERFSAEAKGKVRHSGALHRVIVVHDSGWPAGVLGLIASHLVESCGRPAITMREKGDHLVASCRSLNGFDITQFLRDHALELFTAMGGHAEAGGFTLPKANLNELKKRIEAAAPAYIDPERFAGQLKIDAAVLPEHLSLRLHSQLDALEPFGYGNLQPLLMLRGARILEIKPVGQDGAHLQLPLLAGSRQLSAIAFRFGEHRHRIDRDKAYDIAFHLEVNEWQRRKNLQLRVVDMRVAE